MNNGKRLILAFASVVTVASAAISAMAQDFSIGAWVARCEAKACRASLASATGRQALSLARFSASNGVSIGFVTPFEIADRERPINMRVDGKTVATLEPDRDYRPFERPEAFWVVDDLVAEKILRAVVGGSRLRLEFLDVAGSPHDADFSLDGIAALLDRFDAEVGIKNARTGASVPKSLVAPAPVSKTELIVRQGLPRRLLERHAAVSDCEDPTSSRLKPIPPLVGLLSANAILYAIPCAAAAGTTAYKLWVVDFGEIGGITALYFAVYDDTFGWRGSELLNDVVFDARIGRLVASVGNLGRAGSIGCGTWRWKDYAFAMEIFRVGAACPQGGGREVFRAGR
jgi:hypothetical protein